jgi:hypothetical protein
LKNDSQRSLRSSVSSLLSSSFSTSMNPSSTISSSPSSSPSSSSSSSSSSASSSSSVVEEYLSSSSSSSSSKTSTSPVPLTSGETLLYSSGPSTQRTVFLAWVGAATCSLYLVAVKGAELAYMGTETAGLELLSPSWTAVFAGISLVTVQLARATSSCCIRHAVLEQDGARLRLYPYGTLGFGSGTPVKIPIQLMSLNEDFSIRRKDPEALHVKIKESKAHLIFDKPNLLSVSKSPGAGLSMDKSGAVSLLPSHGGNGEAPLTPIETDQLKKYAVLVQVLSGNMVNASTVNKGAYELNTFKQNMKMTSSDEEQAARSLWKSAVDANGNAYYYNEVTWLRQWAAPKTMVSSSISGSS